MKTFKDLQFTKHPNYNGGFTTHATMQFPNNYGVSVITGYGAYGSDEMPYEVAILYNKSLTYNTPITDDVIGYCDEKKVTEIMKTAQLLK